MSVQNNLEAVGTGIIFTAAVLAALGVLFTKVRNVLRAFRMKFAEQISDVVFGHPSFKNIDRKVDDLGIEVVRNRDAVITVQQELVVNGGESVKDKVNATHKAVSELSLRLGNVEQQLENTAVDSVGKAKEGGRRKGDPPHDGGEFI